MEYKYRLNEVLNLIPQEYYRSSCNELQELLGITRSHFNRIRTILFESKSTLNSDQLLIIASYFNCSIDDLINKPEVEQQELSVVHLFQKAGGM